MRLTGISASALSVIALGIGLAVLFADNLTPTCIGFAHPSMPNEIYPFERSTTTRFIMEQVEAIKVVADLYRLAKLKFGDRAVSILGHLEDLSTDKDVNASVSVIKPQYSWMEVEGLAAFDGLRNLQESILSDPSDCSLLTKGFFTRLSAVLRPPQISREQLAGRIQSITLHLHTLDALQKRFSIYDKGMHELKCTICQQYGPEIASKIVILSDSKGQPPAGGARLFHRAMKGLYLLESLCFKLKKSQTLRNEVVKAIDGKVKTITESLEAIESLKQNVKYASKIDSTASRKLKKQLLEVLEKEIEYFGDFFTDF